MKRPPNPTNEAKERLLKIGEDGIAAFIREVSDLRSLVQYLPTVPGFRKHSQAGIDKQSKELARRINAGASKKSGPEERDYRALYTVWRAWVLERLGDRRAINVAIDAIEEASSGPDNEARAKTVEAAIVSLFTLFRDSSVDGKCSREDIERALQFSPFDGAPLRALVQAARTAADIRRNAQYDELPNQLTKDENDIRAVRAQLDDVVQRLDRVAGAVDGWPIHRTGLLSAIDELRSSVEQRLEALETARSNAPPQAAVKAADPAIESLSARLDNLDQQVASLQTANSNAVDEAIASIKQRLDAAERSLAETPKNDLTDVSSQIKAIEERLDREIAVRLSSTIDPDILKRLNDIEETLAELREQARESPSAPSTAAFEAVEPLSATTTPIPIEPLVLPAKTPPTNASTFAAFVAPLSTMFQDLGLKATAAKTLAEELCVALLDGQAVFLKGAYATETARACASLLCHGNAYRLAIPLGLQQGDDLRRSLLASIVPAEGLLTAIVVEGINMAAFEICKDVLAELATEGASELGRRLGGSLTIATITRGVASLPVETSYLELGPVLDLDCLDWRSKRPSGRDMTVLAASRSDAIKVRATLAAKAVDTDEPQKLVGAFQRARNPRIEHIALSAFTALSACRKDGEIPTPLQSLTYGWLLPLWTAQRASRSEVDVQIDGGKCDATNPDLRLKPLLDGLDAAAETGPS
jgi:tetrahydromethanopterin S-methyltransferase subunit G